MQILIDTGIITDLLSRHEPTYSAVARIFSLAERGRIQLYVPAVAYARISDLLAGHRSSADGKSILRRLQLIVKVLDTDKKIINLYLSDDLFEDFDQGMNYYTAMENGIEVIVTGNPQSYRRSAFPVMSPAQLLGSLRESDAF